MLPELKKQLTPIPQKKRNNLVVFIHFMLTNLQGSRFLLGSLFLASVIFGQGDQNFTYTGKTNPHGSADCAACHSTTGEPGRENYVQTSCAVCHSVDAVNSHIHALFDLNTQASGINMPPDFPLDETQGVTCLTCHQASCNIDRANRSFLRNGPYRVELDFCYSCHDPSVYERANPHNQLRADGTTDGGMCLFCHKQQPKLENDQLVSTEMHLGMDATCNKCHALYKHEDSHTGLNISEAKKATLSRMHSSEKRLKIKFPLSTDNKMQCNTCHYTHGTLGIDQVVYADGGENKHYLRIPDDKLCFACHDL